MSAKFVSANTDWPIVHNWLMVAESGVRYVVLKQGKDLTCRSTKHLQLIDLTKDPPAADVGAVVDREADICTEAAIGTEAACRQAQPHG